MKRRNPHLVFLSQQVLDFFIALKTFVGGSDYFFPSRYYSDLPMSTATINQVLTLTYRLAQKEVQPLSKFGLHDLRRKASTLLPEASQNLDWIEKCLAHEQQGVRAVYNKAEYHDQHRAMLKDWADMIDETVGEGWSRNKAGVYRKRKVSLGGRYVCISISYGKGASDISPESGCYHLAIMKFKQRVLDQNLQNMLTCSL